MKLNLSLKIVLTIANSVDPDEIEFLSLKILSTFIKLPFVIKAFVLSVFEWPFYTGFTVLKNISR